MIRKPIIEWKKILVNDFEKPVFKKYPELERIKQDLYNHGAIYASMTGSGSAIFGIFPH
jgi:4-diphosphocytidyl-2-C-methyl-D-erythritol kinase